MFELIWIFGIRSIGRSSPASLRSVSPFAKSAPATSRRTPCQNLDLVDGTPEQAELVISLLRPGVNLHIDVDSLTTASTLMPALHEVHLFPGLNCGSY